MLIAHRGFSAKFPENTILAFRMAAKCKAIEFDVRKTKDNIPIILHDCTLNRTTTGDGRVDNHTLEEIQNLNILGCNERVPSLDQVLQTFGNDYFYNIEIKSKDTAGVVVNSIKNSGISYNNYIITSFKWPEIRDVRKIDDRINTGLISFARPRRAVNECIKSGCNVAVLNHRIVTRDIIKFAVEHGISVFVFTINDSKDKQRMLNYGVAGIITDEI